ncbi:autotransporter assembly complex protein TamA [Primorskyibacter flagellatus]|uniref:Autotransporter secretion outer membrane protein TamA n=1 Tax=Primorskyibacter flagellatus TaxID=1387277 RepID=A0A1W2DHH3_9RHOB|nr:BamA/TamA family outer membrane protein [Primorskyibacter flagellatus]SMC96971.1 autotransporter secretion outer membrane protein TamA [Primorskyibacter flagellatus]
MRFHMRVGSWAGVAASVVIGISGAPSALWALDSVDFRFANGESELAEDIQDVSLVAAAKDEGRTGPRSILAAALADYARIVETLYTHGYYGGTVNILVDGREASAIPLLDVPTRIDTVAIVVDRGPQFRFGRLSVAPLAPGTELPDGFGPGKKARSPVIRSTVNVAVDGWREVGYAKADVGAQTVTAQHGDSTLSVDVRIAPGPKVRFGDLVITDPSAVRAARIQRIAGLPTGEVYSPDELRRAAERLRRTGAFASVSLTEADLVGPDGSMDVEAALVDEKPRRFGFGAELSSLEGLMLSGFWLHRNLLGGAERLRFDARVSNIGGSSGIDYFAGVKLEIPAALGADTTAFVMAEYELQDEPSYFSEAVTVGGGVTWRLTDNISAEAGISYSYSEISDSFGDRTFQVVAFPTSITRDKRDDVLNATKGTYAKLELTPFAGLQGSDSGTRVYTDIRAYQGFGEEDGVVVAGRLQFGAVLGAGLEKTRPEYLFYSGGPGTVRGQPYQSLDVDLGSGDSSGGRGFVGLSTELRVAVTQSIGVVGFADAGYVSADSSFGDTGDWHAGAGLGLRYQTGIGPIRLDVAAPVSGDTGDGVQFYIGIGQAF